MTPAHHLSFCQFVSSTKENTFRLTVRAGYLEVFSLSACWPVVGVRRFCYLNPKSVNPLLASIYVVAFGN